MKRCLHCMKMNSEEHGKCSYCGEDLEFSQSEVYHLKPGTVLSDRYIIGSVIGFGGFGVVYKSWDDKLERIVAIKEYYPTVFLNRNQETNEVTVFDKKNVDNYLRGKEEFLSEARNIARFNTHPNIVHIYDFFEENATAYFVMEYFEGSPLKDYIKQARKQGQVIEPESALYVVKSLLNALKTTHATGIIHRDIKPGNIYILPDGTVKLFDFGAARFADEETERTRTVIITPGYAPPEQYQKKSKQGPYTDIYAVGALMYEMLTGVKPMESINRKIIDEVENPSRLNQLIPKEISSVIMRAMAIAPEIRFKSVEDFEKALLSPKHVRDDKREIRHMKNKRNFKIFFFITLLILAGVFVGKQYYDSYREAVIAGATVQIWAPTINNDADATRAMYESMLEEFRASNPQVVIELSILDETVYKEQLEQALKTGFGPDLFDSTLLEASMESYFADVSDLFSLKNFDVAQYYFLQNYNALCPSGKRLPLTCDIPVLYTNALNPLVVNGDDYDQYLNNKANYLGTVMDYERVQTDMAGVYAIDTTANDGRQGEFGNLWSIKQGVTKEEKAAAVRILHYFLSEISQETLTIENSQGIPLNKNILSMFVEINYDFAYLEETLEQTSMKQY